MPYVSNRNHQIHYTVEGTGPLLILQHGLFCNARDWKQAGYAESLAVSFTVACVDSLGHGESDKPTRGESYHQSQRAGDIVAVIDALGHDKAHVLGYSMGGWIAVGMAKYFPERLASLTIAGWDCVNGVDTLARSLNIESVSFEFLSEMAMFLAPELLAWVTPEIEPALEVCFEALDDLEGAADAVCGLDVPVLLWNGNEDAYHDPMKIFAEANNLEFLSTPGDHLGALISDDLSKVRAIRMFLQG